jgi:excisionase family DNA binding protein
MKQYTTNQAAGKLGVHRVTLQRWIAGKKIPAPKVQKVGVLSFRLWTQQDIDRARKAIKRRKVKP